MESPDSTDAAAYAQNLALLSNLMPAMPAPARSRAAWAVARSKASLADAIRAEGFDLHGATAAATARATPTTPRAAPVAPRAVASHGAPSPPTVTAEGAAHLRLAGRIMAAASAREKTAVIQQAESQRVTDESRALMGRRPGLSFREAVEIVTARRPS